MLMLQETCFRQGPGRPRVHHSFIKAVAETAVTKARCPGHTRSSIHQPQLARHHNLVHRPAGKAQGQRGRRCWGGQWCSRCGLQVLWWETKALPHMLLAFNDYNRLQVKWTALQFSREKIQPVCKRNWSSGRMAPCHGVGPGSIPGLRIIFPFTHPTRQ